MSITLRRVARHACLAITALGLASCVPQGLPSQGAPGTGIAPATAAGVAAASLPPDARVGSSFRSLTIPPGSTGVDLAAGSVLGYAEGTNTSAKFNAPEGVAVDVNGDVYIADTLNQRIRKMSGGAITTYAGAARGYQDGPISTARFKDPRGIAAYGTNLYVADTLNNRIRKIDTISGMVTTLAGNMPGLADGTGTSASFTWPYDIDCDSAGNLYVADFINNRVRKVSAGGVVTTVGGVITGPQGIGIDRTTDNVYVAQPGATTITKIDTTGTASTFASGIAARDVAYYGTSVFAVDTVNNKIKEYPNVGGSSSLTGTGTGAMNGALTSASFNTPTSLAFDGNGQSFTADTGNHQIRLVVPPAQPTGTLLYKGRTADAVGDAGSVAAYANTYNATIDHQYALTLTMPGTSTKTIQSFKLTNAPGSAPAGVWWTDAGPNWHIKTYKGAVTIREDARISAGTLISNANKVTSPANLGTVTGTVTYNMWVDEGVAQTYFLPGHMYQVDVIFTDGSVSRFVQSNQIPADMPTGSAAFVAFDADACTSSWAPGGGADAHFRLNLNFIAGKTVQYFHLQHLTAFNWWDTNSVWSILKVFNGGTTTDGLVIQPTGSGKIYPPFPAAQNFGTFFGPIIFQAYAYNPGSVFAPGYPAVIDLGFTDGQVARFPATLPVSGPLVPCMTSNTSPSGTCFSVNPWAFSESNVFDCNNSSFWDGYWPGSIGYDWGGPTHTVNSYTMTYSWGSLGGGTKSWNFQGWNGGSWVTVDTVTNEPAWAQGETRTYTVNTPGAYSKYQLSPTASESSNYYIISEMQYFGF